MITVSAWAANEGSARRWRVELGDQAFEGGRELAVVLLGMCAHEFNDFAVAVCRLLPILPAPCS
jgi:hypothetical protein